MKYVRVVMPISGALMAPYDMGWDAAPQGEYSGRHTWSSSREALRFGPISGTFT
jgi:hypothetical protein